MNLLTSHAFHSETFDPIISEFEEFVDQFTLNKPELPFISCLTGDFITDEQATSGQYWAKQLRNSVLFKQGISALTNAEDLIFLEVGPETHLCSLVRRNKNIIDKDLVLSTLGKPDTISERYKIITAIGKLFTYGVNIDFEALNSDCTPYKISLPTYAYDRKRYWIDFEMSTDIEILRTSFQGFKDIDNDRIANDLISSDETGNDDRLSADSDILTRTEQIIFNIWSDAFMTKDISVTDNFFEIGGNSLLAITTMSKIKTVSNVEISLKTFLDNPNIKDLAAFIDASK